MERKSNATQLGKEKKVRQTTIGQSPARQKTKRTRRKRSVSQVTVVTTETWTITWGQDPAVRGQILGEPVIVVSESVEIIPK